jgi:PIN domain nuclease of toxin-antitoxin system
MIYATPPFAYVADTNIVQWAMQNSPRLSSAASAAL